MKPFIGILCSLFLSDIVFSQTSSHIADSLTKSYINKLPANSSRKIFNNILSKRNQYDLYSRIDSTTCDYIYIEETFNNIDSSRSICEYYFNATTNSLYRNNYEDSTILPNLVYFNAKQIDQRYIYYASSITGVIFSGKFEYYYTLDTLLLRCKKILPVQELSHDATPRINNYLQANSEQIIDTSSVKKLESEKKHIDLLKSIYQIVTLVDKRKNNIIVSVQTPAKNPKINSYQLVFHYSQW